MSRIPLLSCDVDGVSNPYWLDNLAVVDSLHLVKGQSGPRTANWNLEVDANFDHPALNVGRWIFAICGAKIEWAGRLLEPGRGNPWTCTADGFAEEAVKFDAYAPTSGNALNLNEVIDAAFTRGLHGTRPSSLPSLTDASLASGAATLNDALSIVATNTGQAWKVSSEGAWTMAAVPTAPTNLLIATDPAGGRTGEDFYTTAVCQYLDEVTRALTTIVVTNAAAVAKAGANETQLDLTDQSYISATNATNQATAYLQTVAPRTKYTGTFNVTGGQVLNMGGVPIDLATLSGNAMLRVMQVNPDIANELDLSVPTDLLLDSIDYDVDADAALITPLDSVAA